MIVIFSSSPLEVTQPSFPCSSYATADCPLAGLLAVSSKDQQPVNRFVDLFNTNQLPSLFNDGAMDPKIPKLYLLVHDNQDAGPDK